MRDSVEHGIPKDGPMSTQNSLQDEVEPRIDLTYGDTPFEPITQDVEMLFDVIRSGSMRKKTTHDPKLGSDVLLVEYLLLSSEDIDRALQSHHVLSARWDNGAQCFFDVEQGEVLGVEQGDGGADEMNKWVTSEMLRVMGLFTGDEN